MKTLKDRVLNWLGLNDAEFDIRHTITIAEDNESRVSELESELGDKASVGDVEYLQDNIDEASSKAYDNEGNIDDLLNRVIELEGKLNTKLQDLDKGVLARIEGKAFNLIIDSNE